MNWENKDKDPWGNKNDAPDFDELMKKFSSIYGATKTAQIHLVKTWQNECKSTGPQIYVLQPNPMPTAVRARFYPGENRKNLQSVKIEAKRLVSIIEL